MKAIQIIKIIGKVFLTLITLHNQFAPKEKKIDINPKYLENDKQN